ncbi:MAG: hypothetical protein Mars2KO_40950 [Maribacter sp.]
MKKTILVVLLALPLICKAQIDGNLLLGLTHATTAETSTIVNAIEGSLLYNSTEKKVMLFNGNGWAEPIVLASDLLDGDDDTIYTAGNGLLLNDTLFSVNNAVIAPEWNNITNVPSTLDLDTANEIQLLSKNGTSIILSNGGGSITETETNLTQNNGSGILTYTSESGSTSTANVVSANANNSITVGSDGGAFLEQTIATTTVLVDTAPGTDPMYTFTTLQDDNRVMNTPTITSLSPISLIAVEKMTIVTSVSN